VLVAKVATLHMGKVEMGVLAIIGQLALQHIMPEVAAVVLEVVMVQLWVRVVMVVEAMVVLLQLTRLLQWMEKLIQEVVVVVLVSTGHQIHKLAVMVVAASLSLDIYREG
jgi:hypothetical protein